MYKAYSTSKLDQMIFTCVHDDKKGTGGLNPWFGYCKFHVSALASGHRNSEILKLDDELTSSGAHKRTTDYERQTDHTHSHPPTHSEADKATGPVTAGPRLFVSVRVCVLVRCYLTVRVCICLDDQGDVAVSHGSLHGSSSASSQPVLTEGGFEFSREAGVKSDKQ